ncbi:MAG: hypothetical protein JXR05_15590 [Flavobacteriaceae bacterium]
MNSKFSKILTIVVALLALIGIALFINVYIVTGDDPETVSSAVGPLIVFSTYLFYAVVAVTVVLSILGLVKNPDNLKKTLLGLAIMGVLLVISYLLGDSSAVFDAKGAVLPGGEEGAFSTKWSSTGIWYSIILGALGFMFFLVDLVKGLIKS